MKENTYPISRWWDLASGLLLVVALQTATARLVVTHWTSDLSIAQTLAFYGVIAGMALGKSRFSSKLASFFASAYGVYGVVWQIGKTVREDILWSERLIVLTNRLQIIYYQISHQETVQDSLLFLVLMSALFWGLSTYAGYMLVRYGDAWSAMIPAGLVMFVIHFFDPLISSRAWYLAAYIFLTLVLIARMVYLHYQDRWQSDRTAIPAQLSMDFTRITLITTLLLVIFAWTVPALANVVPAAQEAWRPVQRAWNQTRQKFEGVFASLKPSVAIVSEVYGDSATLGRGNPLSDTQMFIVNAPASKPAGVRLYWRAHTYDTYADGQWLSLVSQTRPFDPDQDEIMLQEFEGRWLGTFEFISASHFSTLFTPPQPIWVSRPAQIEYSEYPDGSMDITTILATPGLEPGQTYKSQASINYATITQLQASGTVYPEWITERYLQLPDSITPRTITLAEQITTGLDTPYEKVTAITDYLRTNISYVDSIEDEFPRDQEIIDWFLFDLRQGFCNYYATAEVVLLRAIGIPARWAIGYAEGDLVESEFSSEQTGDGQLKYIVRQKDAHAWPEVYFPGIGWVEFEPTVSQPEIPRVPGNTNEIENPQLTGESDEARLRREMQEELESLRKDRGLLDSQEPESSNPGMVYWIMPLSLLALVGLFFLSWQKGWIAIAFQGNAVQIGWRGNQGISIQPQPIPILLERILQRIGIQPPFFVKKWARLATLPPLAKAYNEINRALDRLGITPPPAETPIDRAILLGKRLPSSQRAVQMLVNEYNKEAFSRRPTSIAIARSAAREIRIESIKYMLQRWLYKVQRKQIRKPEPFTQSRSKP